MLASTVRMLTNVKSSLNQKPDWNCWDTTRDVSPTDTARTVCARRSAGGATYSPAWNVAAASGKPTRSTVQPSWPSDTPDARLTVFLQLATSCVIANSVQIKAATVN